MSALKVNKTSKNKKNFVHKFQLKAMAAFVEPHYSALWQGQSGHGNVTVVDKVPPEMLYLVDSHWYQFPPMNPLWHSILGFAIFVLGAISIIGNGVVIYIFTSTKGLRTPSNLLVVNLAISDFMVIFDFRFIVGIQFDNFFFVSIPEDDVYNVSTYGD